MDYDTLMRDLTLVMLSIGSWTERVAGFEERRAWKGYDFDILNGLRDEGLIAGSNRAKSVAITAEGMRQAEELMRRYGFADQVSDAEVAAEETDDDGPCLLVDLEFDFVELTCRRTLSVPRHVTFEDFHTMVQACFGWLNYHMYDFSLVRDGKELFVAWPDYYTGEDPRFEYALVGEQLCAYANSATTYLDDVLVSARTATYSYDYGDGWEIRVTLLGTEDRDPAEGPVCLGGEGDAPPEDVGGEGGFEDFLLVLADSKHEEHEHFKTWGESQGFEHFSVDAANKRLAHWFDWQRADAHEMPVPAQLRAFGEVRYVAPAPDPLASDPDDYDQAVEKNKTDNARYLALFEQWLIAKNLRPRTVSNHVGNMRLFLDDYLNYYEAMPMEQGPMEIGLFLGDWFVRKCMWSSPASMKSTGASIKKFYLCMEESRLVEPGTSHLVNAIVKDGMPDWLEELDQW